jgi:hypothetical protein
MATHVNPAKYEEFELRIAIPARHITEFRFNNCDPGPVAAFSDIIADDKYQRLAVVDIITLAVRAMNARVPPLVDSSLMRTTQHIIDGLCT